jgi:hypothetical protein
MRGLARLVLGVKEAAKRPSPPACRCTSGEPPTYGSTHSLREAGPTESVQATGGDLDPSEGEDILQSEQAGGLPRTPWR